jgi:hypothetical protein
MSDGPGRRAGSSHDARKLRAGGMRALVELVKLTHAGITTDEFATACRRWLASARHPRFGRPYPAMVYQPMRELLDLLGRAGFSCWLRPGTAPGDRQRRGNRVPCRSRRP